MAKFRVLEETYRDGSTIYRVQENFGLFFWETIASLPKKGQAIDYMNREIALRVTRKPSSKKVVRKARG